MEPSPQSTPIQIAVTDDRLRTIDELARRLKAAGMRVDVVNRETGVITGFVDPLHFDDVRRLPGVEAAERWGLVRIGLDTERGHRDR